MSTQERINAISLPAGAGLTDSQFLFVNVNASGQLAFPSAGGRAIGVLLDKPGQNAGTGSAGADQSTGFAARVGLTNGSARLKVTAGGSITAGHDIKAGASGVAVSANTPDDGAVVLGVALEDASSGDVFEYTPIFTLQVVGGG